MKACEYTSYKGIRKESLRDNMSDIEVVLTDLGEIATRELAKEHKPYGLEQNKKMLKWMDMLQKWLEMIPKKNLGKAVISNQNMLPYQYIDENHKLEN